jgi:hypothetical protein
VKVPLGKDSRPLSADEANELLNRPVLGNAFLQVLAPTTTTDAFRSGADPSALQAMTADKSAPFVRVALTPTSKAGSTIVGVEGARSGTPADPDAPSTGRLRRSVDNGYVLDVLYRNVAPSQAERVLKGVEIQ